MSGIINTLGIGSAVSAATSTGSGYSYGGQLWRDLLPTVIDAGVQLGAGQIAKNNNIPYTPPFPGTSPGLNQATNIAGYYGGQVLSKSLGATLRQYWWAVAVPVAILGILIYKLVKKK